MKVTLIIAVYKDIEGLELIFDSLSTQSYDDFEVVVAEDGDSKIMKSFILNVQEKYDFEILHTTQKDIGVRKSKSQNNGIKVSRGEYLIFIDGDCPLYCNFIENHVALSHPKSIVSGRRVNVGPKYSKRLRAKYITSQWLEKNFIRKYLIIKEDAKEERHSEEGFSITPNGWLDTLINKQRKKHFPLLGCNMSMYKISMEKINGFDESLGNAAVAGDTDLEWRFKGIGCEIRPARFMVNQFHLYHQRSVTEYERGVVEAMNKNKEAALFYCLEGLT